jgi:GT2 family glycosyltransferase
MAVGAAGAREVDGNVIEIVPVSVVIPTVGRPALLRACLQSVSECQPRAREIVVVDQSGDDAVRSIVATFSNVGARTLTTDVRNRGLAVNLGMEAADHEIVLVTDDDCTVAPTWVETAWTHLSRDPDAIVTGRVLPAGEAPGIPSLLEEETPRDYTGQVHYGALYGGNMACSRSLVLAVGGFDERVQLAEDNDFCYRWLRAGHPLRYDPELLIWHHGWRSPPELERHYFAYARGQGTFYAKHLRKGDLRVAPFLARDLYRGMRGLVVRAVRRHSEWPDPRRRLLQGVILGLIAGWRTFGPRADGFDPRESVRFRGTSRRPHEGGNGVSP